MDCNSCKCKIQCDELRRLQSLGNWYSYRYTERFPSSTRKDFVCPCCGEKKPISQAYIKQANYEDTKVLGRRMETRTASFEHIICSDCYYYTGNYEDISNKILWITLAIFTGIGLICSFIPPVVHLFDHGDINLMVTFVGLLIGAFLGVALKYIFLFISQVFNKRNLNISPEDAQKYDALIL